jgi:hypothetical protein
VTTAAEQRPLGLETNGINVISEDERKGAPRGLFWPWFAANISVLGLSYGAYALALSGRVSSESVTARIRRRLPRLRVLISAFGEFANLVVNGVQACADCTRRLGEAELVIGVQVQESQEVSGYLRSQYRQ